MMHGIGTPSLRDAAIYYPVESTHPCRGLAYSPSFKEGVREAQGSCIEKQKSPCEKNALFPTTPAYGHPFYIEGELFFRNLQQYGALPKSHAALQRTALRNRW